MLSPEKSQVEICLLKFSLEDIETELLTLRTAWPKSDVELDQKFRESLNAVKGARACSEELEKVHQENVRLVAKRMRLNTQNEELTKALDLAREECNDIQNETQAVKQEIELLVRKYEDVLYEKAARFRDTRVYFDEVEMNRESEKVKVEISKLEAEIATKRAHTRRLRAELDGLRAHVPEDLLDIVGKKVLEEKVKYLIEKCNDLQKKQNDAINNRNNATLSLI